MATRMLSFNNITSSIGASLPNPLRAKKKFHFDVTLTLQELVNCTFVSGVLFAKLQLKDGGSFNGTSHRNDVENHCVQWDEDFTFSCKMYANSSTMILEPCHIKISIRKETKGGKSHTKLGYVKINLAEFAGSGTQQKPYLLESYNENKHKPDNSLLWVKVYLRQTSGDIVFRPAKSRGSRWEKNEEDEGFHDEFLSMYSKGSHSTPRASTGSTMSSFSIATGGTWSSHGGSAGNLKLHDSFGDISKGEVPVVEEDRESGSEETIIGQTSSQITVETTKTGSSNKTEMASTGQTSKEQTGSLDLGKPRSNSLAEEISTIRSSSAGMGSCSLSTSNVVTCSHQGTTPTSPILEESLGMFDPLQPLSLLNPRKKSQEELKSESCKDLQRLPSSTTRLQVPPFIGSSSGPLARRPKAGPSIQSSHVTALPGQQPKSHHRQASVGGYRRHSPSILAGHKRNNSFSTSITTDAPYSETTSIHSNKTRTSTLSTLEQSRVNTDFVIANLIAAQDLTPASDDDAETNLKLYIDKHGGGVTIAGHNLEDRRRFKEIDVSSLSSELNSSRHSQKNRHSKTTMSDHSRSSSDTSASDGR